MSASTVHCPCCGQLNQCAQATSDTPVEQCWCFAVRIDPQRLASLPAAERDRACLCPRCAQGLPPADTAAS
ncbi:MAG TPA: cysteine-rich CWC family protein [Pseudomonas sp.]|uniref:cysteine-rich CWC family protein n=1 Tax=Pseudomonas sp. TaxID=306 RepID=UPI002BCC71D7|nr:cysteine-rich CWC family protein [Pseudomonas sp.]HSX88470.1 cysteine-rich CWC family protein [Pseudomonas sp.]